MIDRAAALAGKIQQLLIGLHCGSGQKLGLDEALQMRGRQYPPALLNPANDRALVSLGREMVRADRKTLRGSAARIHGAAASRACQPEARPLGRTCARRVRRPGADPRLPRSAAAHRGRGAACEVLTRSCYRQAA